MNSLTKPVLIFPLFVLGLVSGVTAAAEEQTELDRRRLETVEDFYKRIINPVSEGLIENGKRAYKKNSGTARVTA